MNQERGQLQPKQIPLAAAALDADHAVESHDNLEVLLMPKSWNKKLPTTYSYYCSLSSSLDLGENPVGEEAEALVTDILEAESLEQAKAGAVRLKAMSQLFLSRPNQVEWLSFEMPTLPLYIDERLSIKAIIETLKGQKKDVQSLEYRHRQNSGEIREVDVCFIPVDLQGHRLLYSLIPYICNRQWAKAELETYVSLLQDLLKQLYPAESSLTSQSKADQEKNTGTLSDAVLQFQYSEHPQLREIFEFIESNYHQPIGLNEIAQAFGYSPSYLTSLVRRLTGQTVYQWIIQRRMFQSRHLLLKTDLTVHEIAEAVGYVDVGHFVKHFRQLHKQPPKTWRNAQRNL